MANPEQDYSLAGSHMSRYLCTLFWLAMGVLGLTLAKWCKNVTADVTQTYYAKKNNLKILIFLVFKLQCIHTFLQVYISEWHGMYGNLYFCYYANKKGLLFIDKSFIVQKKTTKYRITNIIQTKQRTPCTDICLVF